MDPRIQTYIDRVEYFKAQKVLQEKELGNLLLQAQQSPFPEHVRPAEAKDIVPGAVIWHTDADKMCWSIVEIVFGLHTGWPTYSFMKKRYGLHEAYVEVPNG